MFSSRANTALHDLVYSRKNVMSQTYLAAAAGLAECVKYDDRTIRNCSEDSCLSALKLGKNRAGKVRFVYVVGLVFPMHANAKSQKSSKGIGFFHKAVLACARGCCKISSAFNDHTSKPAQGRITVHKAISNG